VGVCGSVPDLVPGGRLQREHALQAVFNGLSYIVRTGNQWRFMPGDLPPWAAIYQRRKGSKVHAAVVRWRSNFPISPLSPIGLQGILQG
jgi:transposase